MRTDSASRLPLYSSVFLISAASLALQVLQMRIFAYVFWQHLAFLVISIAILGFGASGAFLSSWRRLRGADPKKFVVFCSLAFAVLTLLGPQFLRGGSIDIFNELGGRDFLKLGFYFLIFTLPYFFAGSVISIVLTREAEHVSRFYFVNLVGSGLGCFLLFATLTPLGAEGSLLVIAAMGAMAALVCARPAGLKWASSIALLLCLAALPIRDRLFEFETADSKYINTYVVDGASRGAKLVKSLWTPLARIDVVEHIEHDKSATIFQDGDAPAPMPAFALPIPANELHTLAYSLLDKPKVLVIGVGGGFDIKVALHAGASLVVGVEINPTTLHLYRDEYKEMTGKVGERDNVELYVAEGRNFVRRSERKFDLIQMSGVDTYTALSNGAYVLSESYLYTEEAFNDYLDHLEDDGIFCFIRFAFPAPRETLRILVMACEVLAERGAKEAWKHVAVLIPKGKKGGTRLGSILIKKSAFTTAELDKLRAWTKSIAPENPHTDTPYLHDEDKDNPFHAYVKAFRAGKAEEFLASYPYNVRPVQDDKPFFFNQHGLLSLWSWFRDEQFIPFLESLPPVKTREALAAQRSTRVGKRVWVALRKDFQTKPVGLILLAVTFFVLLALVLLCIFFPLFFLKKERREGGTVLAPIGYFSCLGFAYIFVMISAMQRFGLLLGHPSYAISITMATFLIASGIGSLFVGLFPLRMGQKLITSAAILLSVCAVLLAIYMPELHARYLAEDFELRVGITIAVLAPMAFLMGMFFPTGIRMLAKQRGLVPWAYGVNGAASVLASVLAVFGAMILGFTAVHYIAAVLYLLASFFLWRMGKGLVVQEQATKARVVET